MADRTIDRTLASIAVAQSEKLAVIDSLLDAYEATSTYLDKRERARYRTEVRARLLHGAEALENTGVLLNTLVEISMLTHLGGEVDNYGDVVKAVERMTHGGRRTFWMGAGMTVVLMWVLGLLWKMFT